MKSHETRLLDIAARESTAKQRIVRIATRICLPKSLSRLLSAPKGHKSCPMSRPAPYLLALLAAVVAAMLWGTTGTLQSLLPPAREPLVVGAARLCIGALALLFMAMAHAPARRAFGALPLGLLCAAAAAIAAYNMLFFAAVLRAGVGVGTAITIGSAPLWVAAYDLFWRRMRPAPRKAFGQLLAIGGAAMLVLSGHSEGTEPLGLLLAAAAGLSYATYSLASSAMTARSDAPSVTIAAATFALAALFALPVFALLPSAWALSPEALPALLALGLASTGLAYALYTFALTRLAPSTAVTLALAEPLTAWLLALLVVGEAATPLKLAGAALLLAGLYVVTTSRK